jgi:fumarate hydratase class II
LLSDTCHSFTEHCVVGIKPNKKQIAHHLKKSLMLVTALNPVIGYDKAAQVAKKAHAEYTTLREACVALKFLSREEFDKIVVPEKMLGPSA